MSLSANHTDPLQRLRMRTTDRLAVVTVMGGGVGAVCGGFLGGQLSGRQYLAERAHRLPTTVQGWFFYQKWKNYRVILGAMRGATKPGPSSKLRSSRTSHRHGRIAYNQAA
ncbi:hypothetical protein LPJ60_002021 [Coemansia sp. RSA 2675]|nr:hypothetical protein LPJ60_002021 [Coemansia sp. RSA 2675]